MTGKRKRYSADFKAKVALEALRGELTTAQLASKHGIHQTMLGDWKSQAVEGLAAVFSDRSAAQETAKSSEAEVEKLHAKIGQLLVERDFWRKPSVDECRAKAAADRPPTPSAPGYAAVQAGVDQPVRVLLPACRGDAAEPGADAAD